MLGPWKGPEATEHVRIPVGQGICGAAAATGRTEVVDDVNADPRYLSCFPSTRSEIVVPIGHEGRVVGEIDIDSDRPAAFGEDDRALLERVALLISPYSHGSAESPTDGHVELSRPRLREHAAPDHPRWGRSHRGDREDGLAAAASHPADSQG